MIHTPADSAQVMSNIPRSMGCKPLRDRVQIRYPNICVNPNCWRTFPYRVIFCRLLWIHEVAQNGVPPCGAVLGRQCGSRQMIQKVNFRWKKHEGNHGKLRCLARFILHHSSLCKTRQNTKKQLMIYHAISLERMPFSLHWYMLYTRLFGWRYTIISYNLFRLCFSIKCSFAGVFFCSTWSSSIHCTTSLSQLLYPLWSPPKLPDMNPYITNMFILRLIMVFYECIGNPQEIWWDQLRLM